MSIAAFAGFAPPVRAPEVKRRLTGEELEQARIEHRRQVDQERIARMYNARERTIGVDKVALDLQVAENQAKRDLEREAEEVKDEENKALRNALELRERAAAAARRRMEQQCLNFNRFHAFGQQKPEPAPEPVQPSLLERFPGQDLHREVRLRRQRQQQAAWLEEQVFEKRLKEESEKQERAQWGQQVSTVAENMRAVEKNEQQMRKEIERARLNFNEAKAAEGKSDQGFALHQRAQIEEAEMDFHAEDAFLNEFPGRPGLHGNVPRTERKGDDGRLAVEHFRFNQQRANVAKEKENEARRALQQDRADMNAVNRAVKLNEIGAQRSRREAERAAQVANQALAAEQRKRADYSRGAFRNGEVKEEFFQQFGRALR
jgi:hypothetical protein